MREWWKKKKANSRKAKKTKGDYTILDVVFDVLFWIPELFALPFRLIYWIFRGFGRFIVDLFDSFKKNKENGNNNPSSLFFISL